MEKTKYEVFISYSRKDYVDDEGNVLPNNTLSKIKDTLKANGISYWFDEEGIYSGDEFAGVLTNAIRNSRIFLFISSVNSNQSKWTSNEISTALEFKKTIIPLRLDKSPYNDSVMMKIISFDYIEYYDEEKAMSKLLRAIKHHLLYKNSSNQRFVEIPQNSKGATVFMDVDGKRTDHIMSFASDEKVSDCSSVISYKAKAINNENFIGTETDILKSADDIVVHISDRRTPIAIFIGPPAVGKTMTIVRLSKYLRSQGYSITPVQDFRPADNNDYHRLCDSYHYLISNQCVAHRNSINNFLLINVRNDKGRSVLHFFDAPGEIYCKGIDKFPSYIHQLIYAPNPKIWIFMVEPRWGDIEEREAYVKIIRDIKSKFVSSTDKSVLLINKVDTTLHISEKDVVKLHSLMKEIETYYPGIMLPFVNTSLLSIFSKYSCRILPFHTGMYSLTTLGHSLYVPASDFYPKLLWKYLSN